MENQYIKVRGARQHNLKNVNIDIPKNKLVVFTGVSGSGKSSMAFDTIYAEGQRRYVESLSTYARQFLGLLEKPDVDLIEGLSPAISIDQKTTSRNPRSTVGTVTEIYDYLRLLYARVGHPHCPICGSEIKKQSLDEIVSSSLDLITDLVSQKNLMKIFILSPVVSDKKGEFSNLFDNLKSKGYGQVRVDGYVKDTDEDLFLLKNNRHSIDVVIDKLSVEKRNLKDKLYYNNLKSRLSDSINQSLKLSDGLVTITEILDPSFDIPKNPKMFSDHVFSEKFACPKDNIQIPEIEPRSFSFNAPQGACPTCNGIGKILKIETSLIFSPELSILEGGIMPFSNMFENDTWYSRIFLEMAKQNSIDVNIPIKDLSKGKINLLINGTGDKEYKVYGKNRFGEETHIYEKFIGITNELEKRHRETDSDWVRSEIERYMASITCPECNGARLKKESLSVSVNGYSISELTDFPVDKIYETVKNLSEENGILTSKEREIAKLILNEIDKRLDFLISVGLNYLTLSRPSGTLSGGEAQRIRLASQIGSGLTGVLYVLDEPTIGLHQKDNQKLINTLKKLRDLGNSVIVVEHDETMMHEADYIFDFGPGAGKNGGEVIANGNYNDLQKDPDSITGKYLSGEKKILVNFNNNPSSMSFFEERHNGNIKLQSCRLYNLKNIDVTFPLNKFVVITGVSGSGKSTLLVETLYPALLSKINDYSKEHSEIYKEIEGTENVDKVILIDQSPIGKTPRSNPATYTKLFDDIREEFALTRVSKENGFNKGRFSFNVKGGRCEACEGQGQIKIEMQFMSDIWVMCEVCQGKRYNSQTLDVTLRGKNIYDILRMSVSEAIEFFHNNPKILSKLETLESVGLGYMELGQSATTLSGGESQRVKLAAELCRKDTGRTVYILDEPTTGLHFADIEKLLYVLKLLVKRGNSVFIIEHNIDVIKNADWIIDMGPEGGEKGGFVVAEGTPDKIKYTKGSYTGEFL
jgi:excinuclease ABC subunit A